MTKGLETGWLSTNIDDHVGGRAIDAFELFKSESKAKNDRSNKHL